MIPLLVVKNLNKDFESSGESFEVFKSLNLEIYPKTSTALLGESGSGKTTLIHLIAGLESPDTGLIKINNFEIWKYSEQKRADFRLHNIAVIFQQYNLIPSLNILNNIKFHSKLIKKFDQNFQDELIELLGLQGLLKKYPEEISGGQQQRVAIARSLVNNPDLILADEMTGNLDEDTANNIFKFFINYIEQNKKTLVYVTHNKTYSLLADEIYYFKNKKIHLKNE